MDLVGLQHVLGRSGIAFARRRVEALNDEDLERGQTDVAFGQLEAVDVGSDRRSHGPTAESSMYLPWWAADVYSGPVERKNLGALAAPELRPRRWGRPGGDMAGWARPPSRSVWRVSRGSHRRP
jgi:hypothetical protein